MSHLGKENAPESVIINSGKIILCATKKSHRFRLWTQHREFKAHHVRVYSRTQALAHMCIPSPDAYQPGERRWASLYCCRLTRHVYSHNHIWSLVFPARRQHWSAYCSGSSPFLLPQPPPAVKHQFAQGSQNSAPPIEPEEIAEFSARV